MDRIPEGRLPNEKLWDAVRRILIESQKTQTVLGWILFEPAKLKIVL